LEGKSEITTMTTEKEGREETNKTLKRMPLTMYFSPPATPPIATGLETEKKKKRGDEKKMERK
jgi:hypothetical protein